MSTSKNINYWIWSVFKEAFDNADKHLLKKIKSAIVY